jgi:hypothetical protein
MAARPDVPPRRPLSFVHSDEQWDAVTSAPRQEILQLLASRAARTEEPFPDTLAEGMTAWLDDDDLARLHQHLDAIRRLLDSRRSLRKGRLMSLTIALAPILRARNAQHRPTQRLATLKYEAENPAAPHHSRRAKPLRQT